MNRKCLSTEFIVGIFLLAGFAVFVYFSVFMGGMFLKPEGYTLKANFTNVSGLKENANVEIAGVPVGFVQSISLDLDRAIVTMHIKKGVKVQDDSIASIRTKGLIGQKFVKITPGASDDLLADGDRIYDTEGVVDLEELIGKFIYGKE